MKHKPFKCIPGTMVFPEPGINATVCQFDLKTLNIIEKAKADCNLKLDSNLCHQISSLTTPIASRGFNVSHIYMNIRGPQYPARTDIAIPTMSFIDFFSLTSSCFGTWFGVSFMSVTVLFARFTQKRKGKGEPFRRVVVIQNHRTTVEHVHILDRRGLDTNNRLYRYSHQ